MSLWKPIAVLALAAVLTAIPAAAQPHVAVYEPVVTQGDLVPGVGLVTRIDNVAINNGLQWIVEADTDHLDADADQVLLRDQGGTVADLYLREGQSLSQPPGASIGSFDAINISPDGRSGWNFFLDGTSGSGDDSGIYYDTTLVIQEGTFSTAPEFTPGTMYIGFFEAHVNDGPQILVVASVDDPAVPTTVDRALVRVTIDETGALLSEEVIAMEGDTLPWQTEGVTDFGTGPHQTAFNENGDLLFFADLTGLTTQDGVIYQNDQPIAQEGEASPVAGRIYELLSSRSLDMNNHGEYVFKANLDGDAADDEILVKEGRVLAREGESLPDIAPYRITSFGTSSGPVKIGDNGSVLWYGDWDDPDTDRDTGLFLDSTLIVREGDGVGFDVIDLIASGPDAFSMSDNGHWCIFEATFLSGNNTAIVLELQTVTTVEDAAALTPSTTLLRATPNPFSSETVIRYGLTASEEVSLKVYDLRGRLVSTLVDGRLSAGPRENVWNGRDRSGRPVPTGTYFVRLHTKEESRTHRVVVIR